MKTVVLIGATQGTGRELAKHYARQGDRVVISGRDSDRSAEVAAELSKDVPGSVTGVALDLTRPAGVADALAHLDRVDRLAVIGVPRARPAPTGFDVAAGTDLAISKLVGYAAVVGTLHPRMTPDASILLFGGVARTHPYPGSTIITAANAAVSGLVRTMSVGLAPVRVNAIHPGQLEDSPYWVANPAGLAEPRAQTLIGRLGTMRDTVDGSVFLLENELANGIDLRLDGGRR